MQPDIRFVTIGPNGQAPAPAAPWWRFGIMWLVLGGPAAVVIASFALMAVAFRHADTALPEASVAAAPARVSTGASEQPLRYGTAPTAPALEARNHAATPTR